METVHEGGHRLFRYVVVEWNVADSSVVRQIIRHFDIEICVRTRVSSLPQRRRQAALTLRVEGG